MLHRVKKDRDFHEGKWNGLGGKLEAGETPEQCVVREVFEESGLTIRNPRLRGILTFPVFDGTHDWMAFVFTAEDFTGTLLADPPEGHLEWIDDARLLDLPLWEGDKYFLEWLRGERFFSAKFIYKEKRYIRHEVVFY